MTSTLVARCARLLAAVLVLGAMAVGLPSTAAADNPADDLKFMPADSNLLMVIQMEKLITSDSFKKLRKEIPMMDKEFDESFRKHYVIDVGNVQRMVLGGNVKNEPVGVFQLKTAVTADVLKKGGNFKNFKEEKVGTFTLYVPDQEFRDQEHREALCLVNDKTLVHGRVKDLRPVLERNKKPEFSAGMQAALKEIDPAATVNYAVDLKALLGAEKPPMVPGVDFNKVADNASGALLAIKIGKDVEFRGVAVCKDEAGAKEAKKQADALLAFFGDQLKKVPEGRIPKDLVEMPGMVKTSTKDNLGVATLAVKDDTVVALIKSMVLLQGGAAPPPAIGKKP